ncbi:hypothetical protein RHMOL_Rhmol01G0341700 [Rhododendron molle]|uniref:Uncharacterized protein n=1 Tax=Rhododendron molle TaxID=49168 RepID=A0ACC0QA38_RHOML|nr:hypothetical protein RHMOL_Rhmol01G0341700 [Rhododendron molle]
MPGMAVPEVNKRLLGQLQEMGFPLAQATRALHFSDNSSIDAAVNWLFDHQNDPDIDQMPLVPVNIEIETSDPSSVAEEVNLKAQELRDRVRIKKENEEKKLEREREKERRRSGKELLEAKSNQEENERERNIALRKAEKEQEKKDRDRIRQKLQQDKTAEAPRSCTVSGGLLQEHQASKKHFIHSTFPTFPHHSLVKIVAQILFEIFSHLQFSLIPSALFSQAERRRMLGLPVEDPPPSIKSASNLMQQEKVPVKFAIVPTTELMVDCLRSLKRNHKDDGTKAMRAFQTLLIYVRNVAKNPDEEKFRKIRISNPAFQERVGNMKEGTEFLELCGFERVGGEFLFLPRDKVDMEVLKSAGTALNSAITNPFFGLLSK